MKINTGKRLTNAEALDRIFKKCKEKNVEFIGFKNEENVYKNNKTYLILKCNKCNNIWDSTCYDKFINCNKSCPSCAKNKKIAKEEAVGKIVKVCKEKDYEFINFVSGEFNNVNEKLILRCKKCGEIWNTTTFNNFVSHKRNSHSCGRKNPSSMPIVLNESVAINAIKEKLKNSSLEFISFVNGKYTGYNKTHVLLKCNKCGGTNEYSYRNLMSKITVPECKSCEYNGKISTKNAIEKIKGTIYLLTPTRSFE